MLNKKLILSLLLLFILTGFGLRLTFIQQQIFHADEYISLLAISQILEQGLPRFPSGLLYDKGFIYSYLGAGFSYFVGLSQMSARWVSLWLSVLTIPVVYRVTGKFFQSNLAGLFAALILALYPNAMLWGGRVRMYSLTQLLYILALFLIWLGVSRAKPRWRWLGYGILFFGLFNHLVLIVTIPPLVAALFLATSDHHRFNWRRLRQRSIVIEAGLAAMLVGVVVIVGQLGFDARLSATQDVAQIEQPVGFRAVATSVLDTSEAGQGWVSVRDYFSRTSNIPLLVLAVIGLIALGLRWPAKPRTFADRTALFLALTLGLMALEMILFLDGKWRHGRYYFLTIFPLLMMLTGYGVAQVAGLVQTVAGRATGAAGTRFVALLLLLVLGGWTAINLLAESYQEITEPFKKYRYDLGWQYVADQMQPEDTTMAAWPAAAYLYNQRQLDYYANQEVPTVTSQAGHLVDKYAGADFIYTTADLDDVLAQPGRTWLVVEDGRLFNFFETEFIQQIFHQMTLAESFDNIYVFVEKEGRWPLAEQPAVSGQPIDLSGQMKFLGYSLTPTDPAPNQPMHLTLFWQPIAPAYNYKIFVHLRNEAGETVAQADFVPLEGATVDLQGWVRREGTDEILRTATVLHPPADLSPGVYSLWAGMYEPFTFARLPVSQDISGENAIKLGEVVIKAPASDGLDNLTNN